MALAQKAQSALLKVTVSSKAKQLEYATPYLLTDLSVVERKVSQFKKLLPTVDIYYAIKANNDAQIIKRVNTKVKGYDIASLGELEYLLARGVDPDRIMYSNPVKIPHHIERAYEIGVRYFAFDSITEVEKIAKHAPGSNVYLRIKVSDYGSKFPLSKKFGVDAMHAVDYCSIAADAGLNVVGVTFHVGSQSENVQVWKASLEIAGGVIKRLREKELPISFLDIGGGFPADYGEPSPKLKEVAAAIYEGVAAFIPNDIKLIAEPGRYIAANAGTMVTSVIGREHRSGSDWLYLDVGTFQGLIEPLEMPDLRYPIRTDKSPKGYKKSFTLSGPTCDAFDTLGSDYMLPSDITVGDKVYIESAGAYSIVYGSNFNGFEKPDVHYVN